MSDSNNSDAGAAGQAPTRSEFLDALTRRRLSWALGIAGGLVLVLLAATYGAYLRHFHGPASTDPAAWGQFGDFVGGTLNSLMGLLTLLALVFTVVLQTRQLELSRDELRATRDELARSTAAQRDTAAAMEGQLEQARLTAEAQKEAARSLSLAATYQRDSVKLMMDQAQEAKRTARIQTLHAALQATHSQLAEFHRLTGRQVTAAVDLEDQLAWAVDRKAALEKALHDAADEHMW